ncbi:MAG: HyaD/HybD family hydrogenase maturation endopeptidase [Nitrospirae bacterium]|nr:HyaD/HybD family hydrogenase maturation endopeptidase [Nitrospirota bacterium]
MKITILGIGNILYSDEGFGVRVIEELRKMDLPENVELIEGGTDGAKLLPVIMQSDYLIIVDAIRADEDTGAIFRIPIEEVRQRPHINTSLHQMGIMEVIGMANILGSQVKGVIIGIQPKDISTLRESLSPEIKKRIPNAIELIMREVYCYA